ncbi:capsule polysaccharide biosynthesis protein [Xylariomycetidae sp. FL2044]|nr:capsule polysaccharide biosynthesis protein [Xylariomycetidae sp. FL2044]
MASAAGAMARMGRFAVPVLVPAVLYGAYRGNVAGMLGSFFTGPGRNSRIIALVVLMLNWKSLPLAWTVRVWSSIVANFLFRPFHTHTPDRLFQPIITESHVALLEVDYNVHKSNSTYFADLDVSRSHLVSHLFARGCHALGHNATTKLVMDPSDPSRTAKGKFSVMLGAVHCSFKKELAPYQRYEMWSKMLGWDRKWLYVVTHFVEKGAAKSQQADWQKKIHATAVSKYVFKMGRLTVHPAIVIEASGLLPERPGGWTGESDIVSPAVADDESVAGTGDTDTTNEDVWDWRRVERERKKGEEFVRSFAALDGAHSIFDAGKDGVLGRFGLG